MPSEKIVYPAVGRCIYCGAENLILSDEHIIPFGLGGNWILPKSSCKACATITGQLEQFCLRSMLGNTRIRLNLPTRRPKERPTELPVEFIRVNGRREKEIIPASEVPFACIGFRFPEPGILRGVPPTDNYDNGELVVRDINNNLARYIKPEGQKVKIGEINILSFTRMLAKIAHSYAIAQFGLNEYIHFLPDLILGKSSIAPYLVGGEISTIASSTEPLVLHKVDLLECLSGGELYMLAAIQLFTMFGMPTYCVVFGKKFPKITQITNNENDPI